LTGFLVAFFFAMVLLSFGLDLAVLAAGFFVAGIRYSPVRSLLLGERRNCGWADHPSVAGIIEMRYGRFKSFPLSL
jgi:hypothetical protein